MITQNILKEIADALRAKDEVRLSTLRMLSSALNYEKIAKQKELSQEEELAVVRKEAKKRTEAIEIYEKHKNSKTERLKNREAQELAVLKEYLPKEMEDVELEVLVKKAIEELGVKEVSKMGQVIGRVMKEVGARASGERVSVMVKEKLSG